MDSYNGGRGGGAGRRKKKKKKKKTKNLQNKSKHKNTNTVLISGPPVGAAQILNWLYSCMSLPPVSTTFGTSVFSFMGALNDLLEKEMATHSSILAWRITWTDNNLSYIP